jgi:hypothetical protein
MTSRFEWKDIPKLGKGDELGEKNYHKWQILMRDISDAKELWDVSTTDPASGVSKDEDKTEKGVDDLMLDISRIKDHAVKHKFCLLAIRQNVTDIQFDHVAECKWAYTACKILEGVHKGKSVHI